MSRTFEQGWAARPFKEQFPVLEDKQAERLDRLNGAITDLYVGGMLTASQMNAIRSKKMPRAVSEALAKAEKLTQEHQS